MQLTQGAYEMDLASLTPGDIVLVPGHSGTCEGVIVKITPPVAKDPARKFALVDISVPRHKGSKSKFPYDVTSLPGVQSDPCVYCFLTRTGRSLLPAHVDCARGFTIDGRTRDIRYNGPITALASAWTGRRARPVYSDASGTEFDLRPKNSF